MNLNNELNNIDYFKLKNITSIYVNEEIKLMNNSDMNSIISEYGFDNSISNYKKHYKILDNINLIMLTYNIINNNTNSFQNTNNNNIINNTNHNNIINNTNHIDPTMYYKLEKEMIEKEYQYKLEIQQLKLENEINKKEFEKQLNDKEKEFENQILKLQINTSNITNNTTHNTNTTNNTNNTTINNNVKISKIQYLNLNFRNVIDMNTFLTNYNNSYGLTSDQAKTLLENSENDGITACINGIIYYLKKSAVKQYKDIKGEDIAMENIILPFLLSDRCVRDHFEKSSDNKWDKTTMIDNINKIVSITNNQVFKHHNKYMNFNSKQKKRIINGLLKQSGYDMV